MNSSRTQSEAEQSMLDDMKRGVIFIDPDKAKDVAFLEIFAIARRMRDIRRLAGFQCIRPYFDSDHCFYTALLFMEIAEKENVQYTKDQIRFVMMHDILEVLTGDLLYPAKNTNEDTKKAWDIIEQEVEKTIPCLSGFAETSARAYFDSYSWSLFKDCDALELWMCCREEVKFGNVMKNVDGSTVEETMAKILRASLFPSVRTLVGA